MMNLTEFRQQRAIIEEKIYPYKIVRLDEVKQVEANVYSIGNMDVNLSTNAQKALDRAIGTTEEQLKMVKGCSGDNGQANFRNYLSVAKNISEEKQVVLVADPETKIISNVIIPEQDFIPISSFFDFAEMFIDSTNTLVEKVERSLQGNMDVRIFLQPARPLIQSLGIDEDFIANGLYLHWDGKSIEFGSYFIRLVCMNGQTEEIRKRSSIIFSLHQEEVSKMLKLAIMPEIQQQAFDSFRMKALEAMDTCVSLRELGRVYATLKGYRFMLPSEIASSIAPHNEYMEYFKARGIETAGKEKLVKTDINWWKFYNKLTQFATHNTFMATDDIVRTNIIILAMDSLLKERDIKNYIEYV